MEKIKLRRKRSLGFATANKPFAATKRFATTKIKLDEKTILGFAATKKPFASMKRFTTTKDVARRSKGKMLKMPVSSSSQ